LRARPHRRRLNRHASLGVSDCADAGPQEEKANNRGATEKPIRHSQFRSPCGVLTRTSPVRRYQCDETPMRSLIENRRHSPCRELAIVTGPAVASLKLPQMRKEWPQDLLDAE
jgi:hypothetical protein